MGPRRFHRSSSAPDLPHPPARMSKLLSLPDDALLAVLSFVSARQLFSCRAVCKRFRDLCLHQHLWKHVTVDTAGTLRAALALAPCLGQIEQGVTDLKNFASLALNSTCVVTALELRVGDRDDAAFATSIILKLSALGGLRKLRLEIACSFSRTFTDVLLQAVYNLEGLEVLGIDNDYGSEVPAPLCDREVRPSLTKLEYSSSATDPFLQALLSTHADSLEDVDLYGVMSNAIVPLLALISGLRYLTCPAVNELSALAVLPNLEYIHLLGNLVGENTIPPGALDFLREASHIRKVEFMFPSQDPAGPFLALAASPSAGIVETVVATGTAEESILGLVALVLPKFSSMKSLSVECVPPDVFLRDVSPTSMPCLNLLKVCSPVGTCVHTWLHYPAVQDLLKRNPQLHLSLHGDWNTFGCWCAWCRWGCHAELKRTVAYVFTAHIRKTCCPINCLPADVFIQPV